MTASPRNRIFKRVALAGAIIVLLATSYTMVFAKQLRCALVAHSDLRRVNGSLWVDPRMPAGEAEAIGEMMLEGRRRAARLLGSSMARPTVIAGADMEVIERFGQDGNPTAVTHLHLGGAWIVLGPDGLNGEVIAHEMMHAELAARVGWLTREIEIPTWFDEGLAMQVDHRAEYSEEAWARETNGGATAPRLDELAESDMFGSTEYWRAFATSKHEVKRWLDVVGTDGLRDLLGRLDAGASFEEAYHGIERERRRAPSGK